jgi:dipeptide/tripeptide permease
MTDLSTPKPKFPATFWTANTIELFERAAYYSMASFMVIYLKESLPLKEGRPVDTVTMWLIIVGIGVLSVIALAIYDRVVVRAKKA